MASITSADYSSILSFLLLVFFSDPLLTVFCILRSILQTTHLVRSLQLGRLLARSFFSWSFLPFTTIATHLIAPHFPLRLHGSYETRDWCLKANLALGIFQTWSGKANEKQGPHSAGAAWQEGGGTSSQLSLHRSCYNTVFDTLRSRQSLYVFVNPCHTADQTSLRTY